MLGLIGSLSVLGSCGDDSSDPVGEGCVLDVQCKGDRVCMRGECVDPMGGPDGGEGTPDGGDAGPTAGSGGSGPIDDPEFERVCISNCEARLAASCSMNIGSLDQCIAQCLVADEANYGYCLEESTNQYACLASGGYTCVSGYPQPKATCIAENQALSLCGQQTPCRMFCARADGECAASGEDCVTECLDEQTSFADAICGYYYSQLLSCWGQNLTCVDGMPAIDPCGQAAANVADCIGSRNHECDGFCWLAEKLGCAPDNCLSDCRAKADASSCGSAYRSLLDCTFTNRELSLSCDGGEPTPAASCATYSEQYATCMQQNP